MKTRPIIFSGPMVKAILEGKKTQTRRVMKPQPEHIENGMYKWRQWLPWLPQDAHLLVEHCPFGAPGDPSLGIPGDRLWVRETFSDLRPYQDRWAYRADISDIITKWTPSIFMPRRASRITLQITGVRVERVQDITWQDACAEGIDDKVMLISNQSAVKQAEVCKKIAVERFQELWNSINAKRGFGWDVNPWVWCISFRRIDDA